MSIQPDYAQFLKQARHGNLIPVFIEQLADLETPVSLFLKVAGKDQHSFLLESAEFEESIGRYSLVGAKPSAVAELKGSVLTIKRDRQTKRIPVSNREDAQAALNGLLRSYRFVKNPKLPSFVGGLVGYLGYEFVTLCDDIKLRNKPGLNTPDAVLLMAQNLIVYDHFEHKIQLIHLADTRAKSAKHAFQIAQRELKDMQQKISSKPSALAALETKQTKLKSTPIRSNVSKKQFVSSVNKIKSYIRAGDCIQTVLSQRFKLPKIKNDFAVYRALRSLNPSPYMFYFRSASLRLVGSSPEMLVKKQRGLVETRPIAGTRPRGHNEVSDKKLEESLKTSKKEMAEHLMLVDLGRNDLGRVCDYSSVRVRHFAQVERFSHVMHLVSYVEGKVLKNKSALEVISACYPAGTVSGAPKIRAMQIIDELEPEKRGPYAGAVGYIGFDGDFDLCITIRTILIQGKNAYVQAGAGIVNDSNPDKEYQETINKAKALMRAVEMAG